MPAKNETEVVIGGKSFKLSGYESEEYLQKVAAYISAKLVDFKKSEIYRRQSSDVQATLIEINSCLRSYISLSRFSRSASSSSPSFFALK